mgnify:FL=1
MTDLTSIGMVAQGSDPEGWVNIIFIVVMVLFWLVGGLIKVLQQRKGPPSGQKKRAGLAGEQQRGRERWQDRLARKAEEIQRAAEGRQQQVTDRARRAQEQVANRGQGGKAGRPAGSQPPGGRLTVRQGPRGESVMVYEKPTSAKEKTAERQQAARQAVATARRQPVRETPPVQPPVERVRTPDESRTVEQVPDAMPEPPKPLKPRRETLATPRRSTGPMPEAILDAGDPEALRRAIVHYEVLSKPIALRDRPEPGAGF